MTGRGQEERFPSPRLNGRCRFRERSVVVDDYADVGFWVRLSVLAGMISACRLDVLGMDEAEGRAEMEAIWHPEGVWAVFLARRQDR